MNWAERLIVPLYENKFLETLWNAEKEENRQEGWRLVSLMWAPWYFNMRPVGDAPELFNDICRAMAEMISGFYCNLLIGVEMAGVPLVSAIASKMYQQCREIRFGYTRPMPIKGAKPEQVAKMFRDIEAGVSNLVSYGQKDFVEARFRDGDIIGIVDDMATTIGSKIVARAIVLWVAKRMGINVTCNQIFYLLNRGIGNRQKGIDFAKETDPDLFPAELDVNYVIEFDEALPLLKKVMKPGEYQSIIDFQKDPKFFQGAENSERAKLIAAAARGL